MNAPEYYFDVQPSAGNHFAWIRTVIALQRTLMAAVRTAVSLVGFGFTVAQFFQRLVNNAPDEIREIRAETPRNLGLVLIAAGVISLAMFTWQYHQAIRYMHSDELKKLAGPSARTSRNSSATRAVLAPCVTSASRFL